MLQFGGHHLAVSNTYEDGFLVGATPSFRGIEPFWPFDHRGIINQPERAAQVALASLLASLTRQQASQAKLEGRHDDLKLGPHRDWAFPERSEGIAGVALDEHQRELLLTAIGRYVGDLPAAEAVAIVDRYRDELLDTKVGYSGSVRLASPGDYVRIDGPSVWIEFSMHEGIVQPGAHPHAVWRDKVTDYGGKRRGIDSAAS
jgi:hypothetical protein